MRPGSAARALHERVLAAEPLIGSPPSQRPAQATQVSPRWARGPCSTSSLEDEGARAAVTRGSAPIGELRGAAALVRDARNLRPYVSTPAPAAPRCCTATTMLLLHFRCVGAPLRRGSSPNMLSTKVSAWAALEAGAPLVPYEFTLDEHPPPGYVDVAIRYCGICGSDVHQIQDVGHRELSARGRPRNCGRRRGGRRRRAALRGGRPRGDRRAAQLVRRVLLLRFGPRECVPLDHQDLRRQGQGQGWLRVANPVPERVGLPDTGGLG